MENNKIGSAIQYFRESYHISQSKLGKGLCSVATLSRIEAGERDVDSLLLETLLERLGKTPNQFELILTDSDYIMYQSREEIRKKIKEKNYNDAYALLSDYEKTAAAKGTVHMQFITTCKALLNELNSGNINTTIELLMDAITCTVPDFKTNKLKDYYLSFSELSIITDIVQRMFTADMSIRAKEILLQVIDYLDLHNTMEDNKRIYPRVAVIAGKIYMQETNLNKALEICNKGLEKNKGSRQMDYVGELYYLKAQSTEALLRSNNQWNGSKEECLKLYLEAYYMLDVCEDYDKSDKIKRYLQEEYQWEDTV